MGSPDPTDRGTRGRSSIRSCSTYTRRRARARVRRGRGRGGRRAVVLREPEAARADRADRPCCSSSASTSCCRSCVGDQDATREARRRRTRSGSRSRSGSPWSMFGAYVALFRGVVGERVKLRWKDSYEITMAGLAATRLFSAGGAGGIVLTYWALRKAGMPRKETAARMVAFLVLLYAVYMLTLLINGILLRTGVFSGPAPPGLTIVPAAIAGGVIVVFLLMALVPGDLERRFSEASQEKLSGAGSRAAWRPCPSTAAVGTRGGARLRPRAVARRARASLGAIGFWAAQIGILWASFKAFGVDGPARGRRPGLLRRHVRQPDPAARRGRRGRRGDARRLRALRRPRPIFAADPASTGSSPSGCRSRPVSSPSSSCARPSTRWEETRRPARRVGHRAGSPRLRGHYFIK